MDHKPFINYHKEAFLLPINLTYLACAVVAVFSVSILGFYELAMIIAAAASSLEMFFLSIAPQNKYFVRAVNGRLAPALNKINKQVQSFKFLQQLGSEYLERYMSFYKKKQSIINNLFKEEEKSRLIDSTFIDKLSSLESYYIELLYGIEQYQHLLTTSGNDVIDSEVAKIKQEMETASEKVKVELAKRSQLLLRRKKRLLDAKDSVDVAKVQLDTVEDTINYVLEQSINLKNPLEINRAIDEVILSAETYSSDLEELDHLMNEFHSPNPQIERGDKGSAAYLQGDDLFQRD